MTQPSSTRRRIALGVLLLLTAGVFAGSRYLVEPAWTKADATALVSYAVAVGRADACGASVAVETQLLTNWVARHFQPFPDQFQALLTQTTAQQKAQQAQHPVESCVAVKEAFVAIDWSPVKPVAWKVWQQ